MIEIHWDADCNGLTNKNKLEEILDPIKVVEFESDFDLTEH